LLVGLGIFGRWGMILFFRVFLALWPDGEQNFSRIWCYTNIGWNLSWFNLLLNGCKPCNFMNFCYFLIFSFFFLHFLPPWCKDSTVGLPFLFSFFYSSSLPMMM
jgi:hypothetical protein